MKQFSRPVIVGTLAFLTKIVLVVGAVTVYISIMAAKGDLTGPQIEAEAERVGNTIGIIAGAIASFLGAWWVARKRGERAVLDGFIVAAVMSALEIIIVALRGEVSASSLVAVAVNALGAGAGIVFARLLSRAPVTPTDV